MEKSTSKRRVCFGNRRIPRCRLKQEQGSCDSRKVTTGTTNEPYCRADVQRGEGLRACRSSLVADVHALSSHRPRFFEICRRQSFRGKARLCHDRPRKRLLDTHRGEDQGIPKPAGLGALREHLRRPLQTLATAAVLHGSTRFSFWLPLLLLSQPWNEGMFFKFIVLLTFTQVYKQERCFDLWDLHIVPLIKQFQEGSLPMRVNSQQKKSLMGLLTQLLKTTELWIEYQ